MDPKTVTVYCSSSERIPSIYLDEASRLGKLLANKGVRLVYGGGKAGSMGRVADGALAAGGTVIGYIPQFMRDVEWGHDGISELNIVESMHERKRLLMEKSDALITLPGGTGTLEELYEAVSAKRLGLFTGPILLVNTNGFFDPLLGMMRRAIDENFMHTRHDEIWTVINTVEDTFEGFARAKPWDKDAIKFAVPQKTH